MRWRRLTISVALGLGLAQLTMPAAPAAAVIPRADAEVVVADSPAPGTPHVMNGAVLGITQVGDTMVAVGTFTRVSPAATWDDRGDDLVRRGAFAFDAETGAIDRSFKPRLEGEVYSVDTDGTHVYLAGAFRVAGTTAGRRVVKLDARGEVVNSFRATPDAKVLEVVVQGRRVFIGGAFTRIGANGRYVARRGLAALDSGTGAVLRSVAVPFAGTYNPAWSSRTSVKGLDLSANGRRLVAVGNFSRVGGRPRVQVAVLDVSGSRARVTRWASRRFDRHHNSCARKFQSFVRDVEFAPGDSWFAVVTTGGYAGGVRAGTLCDTVSRWPARGSGRQPTWVAYTGGDTVNGLEITSSALYAGGHMRWFNNPFQKGQPGPGAVKREGIAALDPVNGVPLSWNPGRPRGVGAQALLSTSLGLWVGSDTIRIGGQRRGRIALMPWVGGTRVPDVNPAALPNTLFLAPRSGGVLRQRPVDARGVPTGPATPIGSGMDWSRVRGAFLIDDTVYYGRSVGGFYRRTFDPTTGDVGPARRVDLNDDPQTGKRIPFPLPRVTGMFYDPRLHRLYYTVDGDRRLFYRGFTPESRIVGAETFTAARHGVDFHRVAGMTLAGGWVLYGSDDGKLRRVRFGSGRVTSRPHTASGDGSWRGARDLRADGLTRPAGHGHSPLTRSRADWSSDSEEAGAGLRPRRSPHGHARQSAAGLHHAFRRGRGRGLGHPGPGPGCRRGTTRPDRGRR